MVIENFGKGGSTSSGDWHVYYSITRYTFSGKPYKALLQKSFFTKRAMQAFIDENKAS